MNYTMIVGRLTEAPTAGETPNGTSFSKFTVAVNRRSNKELTDYIPVVAWRELGANCKQYLVKGQRVAVMGELHIESYKDKDGNPRSRTGVVANDVEFLDKPVEKKEAKQEDFFGAEVSGSDLPF